MRVVTIVGALVGIGLLAIYVVFDSPLAEVNVPPTAGPVGLTYSLRYYPVLVAGDDQDFTITLTNTSPIALTQTTVTLILPANLPVTTPTDKGTSADFGTLASGETKTRTLTLRLENPAARAAHTAFVLSTANVTSQTLTTADLTIPTVPYLRRVLRLALGLLPWASGVIAWLVSSAFGELFPRKP